MVPTDGFTFRKAERVTEKSLIELLFSSGSRAMTAYPLRMVYRFVDRPRDKAPVMTLIVAPKRHLRHAVDRNRVKRQLREAYRLRKATLQPLLDKMPATQSLVMAFIWQESGKRTTEKVEKCMQTLLNRLAEMP